MNGETLTVRVVTALLEGKLSVALLVVIVVTEEGEELEVGLMLAVEATTEAEGGLLLELVVLLVTPGTESCGLVDVTTPDVLLVKGLLLLVTGDV